MDSLCLLALLLLCCLAAAEAEKQTYIVHMAKFQMPAAFVEHGDWYDASLRAVSDTAEILYSYDTVAHGFSARLTAAEASALEGLPGVLGVHPEVRYELHTTRTPEFLGIDHGEGFVPQSDFNSDIVVGVLDTGVWPERRSYDDAGLGPVTVTAPAEVKVAVDPQELSFAAAGEKKSYTVSFSAASQPSGSAAFGRLEWTDGKHVVASPLAFTWT
ncbi:hypothetical protein ZIOFF_016734 [Zingiber officinale]|uniref:Uncharacterized protein n=1 Tax=Zingiber officinale TaxID=94328 RepID=A0A8J5HFY6_ZINOF|nr:hypothetical protein ZIOFF_016734 [Zingiber officinale]